MDTYDTRKHYYLYYVNGDSEEFTGETFTCERIMDAAKVFRKLTGRGKWRIEQSGYAARLCSMDTGEWCVEHGLSMSNVLRVVALAGARDDRRLSALVKDYDSDEAKP